MLSAAPTVFVFVPSYNHAPFIERCLQSIIKQTVQPTKLLVIDDGSSDDSSRIIEEILQSCPFPAEFIQRENRGLCATLNEGFAHSAGYKYFAYLGSDDVWLPNFLANRTQLMETKPEAVLAFGNAFLINDHDRVLEDSTDWGAYKFPNHQEMLLRGFAPISSTVFYRRAKLEKVRWNENARLEDYEFYLKLAPLGDFAFDPRIDAAWREHDYNTSGDTPMMLREVIAAQNRNAALLSVDAATLREIQREVKFFYAEILARRGWKKEALQLTIENWRGAYSGLSLLKMAGRFVIPNSFLKWRRKRKMQSAAQKHGAIQI